MANIRIDLDHEIMDGESVTFKAPCDCTAVTGVIVYYPTVTESSATTASKVFTFRDAHKNDLTGVGNLFTTDAYVKCVLDTTNNYAYIQNQDTNAYLEGKFSAITPANIGAAASSHTHTKSQISDFPSSMPASDVYSWAKAASKPTYTASEVGAAASGHKHTKSEITDFPTSMPASDVYSWAKAASKPSYTASEVGAAASSHNHSAANITSGTLATDRGGTGRTDGAVTKVVVDSTVCTLRTGTSGANGYITLVLE